MLPETSKAAHDTHAPFQIGGVAQVLKRVDLCLGRCKPMLADVKFQEFNCVRHEKAFLGVCLETACDQLVEYLPDVLNVLNRSAAVHNTG